MNVGDSLSGIMAIVQDPPVPGWFKAQISRNASRFYG